MTHGPRSPFEISGPASLSAWLNSGGDRRIIPDAGTGLNRYGCASIPDPRLKSYSSSTASTISPQAFAAAEKLYDRLKLYKRSNLEFSVYAQELSRIRENLSDLLGLSKQSGIDIIFGASGTDLHFIAGQIAAAGPVPLHIVLPEPAETGSDVPWALEGHDPNDRSFTNPESSKIELSSVALRLPNGEPRSPQAIDDQVEATVTGALAKGQRVLLIVTDLSKTGLLAPSPALAENLKRRFSPHLEVLVDACQFRLSPRSLDAYLRRDFLVAITGSKFVTGPAFSGALLIPPEASQRLRHHPLDASFLAQSSRANWTKNWKNAVSLETSNVGLLLRWEAALEELRAFCRLPEEAIDIFYTLLPGPWRKN